MTSELIYSAEDRDSSIQRRIIWQNVLLAFGVKLLVLILGASGIATLWEAVFADVGVTLIAIMKLYQTL
ncbi:hypothetical protein [Bacteroides fragilis]|uniref:hypothetical protein n=1 Tax=Bacteroides fragilis TaxID=817 RepID=UPI0005CE9268|nr:hypothetical protein [Bacteroides fragilis]